MTTSKLPFFLSLLVISASVSLFGTTPITVDTYTDMDQVTQGLYGPMIDLRGAINHANNNPVAGGYTINFSQSGQTIPLGAMLPLLNYVNNDPNSPLIIDGGSGAPTIIDGGGLYRGLFARQGVVTLNNLQIQN